MTHGRKDMVSLPLATLKDLVKLAKAHQHYKDGTYYALNSIYEAERAMVANEDPNRELYLRIVCSNRIL